MKDVVENALKNHVFFGASIWKGFGEGFGRVLGGRNPRFSHFFRHFFEANFKAFFGRLKNRKKERQPEVARRFWAGPAECARPGGEIERG